MHFPRVLLAALLPVFLPATALSAEVSPGTKKLPLPGESLLFDGREAFVIPAEKPAPGNPWAWYAPTLKGLPSKEEAWMFRQFLAKGIAIAGIDVGEAYGSPEGRKTYSAYHAYLAGERGFSEKPVLLARSRGGLMPATVAALAA